MPTDKKQIKEAIRREFKKCARDPVHFLRRYCYIQHPLKGKIKFDLFDYQEKTLKEHCKAKSGFQFKPWFSDSLPPP